MKTLLLEQSNVYKKSSDSCTEIVQAVLVYDRDYSRLQLSCIAREIKYCPRKCKESLKCPEANYCTTFNGKSSFQFETDGIQGSNVNKV